MSIQVEAVNTTKGAAEAFFHEPDQILGCEKEPGYWVAALLDPRGREFMAIEQAQGSTKQEAIAKLENSSFEFTSKEVVTKAGKTRITVVHEKITDGVFSGSKEKMGEICEYLEIYQPEHGKNAGDVEYEIQSNYVWKPAESVGAAVNALKYDNR